MVVNGVRVVAGVVLSGVAVGVPVGFLTKGVGGVPMLTTKSENGGGSLGIQIKSEKDIVAEGGALV